MSLNPIPRAISARSSLSRDDRAPAAPPPPPRSSDSSAGASPTRPRYRILFEGSAPTGLVFAPRHDRRAAAGRDGEIHASSTGGGSRSAWRARLPHRGRMPDPLPRAGPGARRAGHANGCSRRRWPCLAPRCERVRVKNCTLDHPALCPLSQGGLPALSRASKAFPIRAFPACCRATRRRKSH